jgi:hypothetical protein
VSSSANGTRYGVDTKVDGNVGDVRFGFAVRSGWAAIQSVCSMHQCPVHGI